MNLNHDREILMSVFTARFTLAKETEDEAAAAARAEWKETQAWVASKSAKVHSFIWYCDELDLEPDAVRRAIEKGRLQ